MVVGAIFIGLFVLIFCGYVWMKERRSLRWERRQIPYLKSESLILGSLVKKLSLAENIQKFYEDLAPHRFGGCHLSFKPVLCIRDPELIKCIMIKDFHHFCDREFNWASKTDILSQNLFHLAGDEWRILRHKLTPTFSLGKMKILFSLVKSCALQMEEILKNNAVKEETVDVKDLMSR